MLERSYRHQLRVVQASIVRPRHHLHHVLLDVGGDFGFDLSQSLRVGLRRS